MSNPPIAPQVAMAASIAEPGADIYRMLLKDRIVVLGSDVNDAVANQIVAQLLYLEGEDSPVGGGNSHDERRLTPRAALGMEQTKDQRRDDDASRQIPASAEGPKEESPEEQLLDDRRADCDEEENDERRQRAGFRRKELGIRWGWIAGNQHPDNSAKC